MVDAELPLTSPAIAPRVRDVCSFLAGAAAAGVCLASVVRYAAGETPLIPRLFPAWAWLLGAALVLASALSERSPRARAADGLMAFALLCGAATAWLGEARVVLLGQALCLGAWGATAVQRSRRGMPASLARAGLALGIATASAGFLPGIWKWVSLGAVVIVVLAAVWMLDNLEADGAIIGDEERTSKKALSRTARGRS